jgi:hypothetical protein
MNLSFAHPGTPVAGTAIGRKVQTETPTHDACNQISDFIDDGLRKILPKEHP